MKERKYTSKELKLTAALYIQKPGVLEYVKKHGTLPKKINTGGIYIGMRLLIEHRGTDIELSEDEKLVYDAILVSGRLPGGVVNLVEDHPEDLE
jgi:hypothetical protein